MWQGVVLAVTDQEFRALIYDLDGIGGIEIGEFKIARVTPSEALLVAPGAIFHWTLANGTGIFHFDKAARLTEEKFCQVVARFGVDFPA